MMQLIVCVSSRMLQFRAVFDNPPLGGLSPTKSGPPFFQNITQKHFIFPQEMLCTHLTIVKVFFNLVTVVTFTFSVSMVTDGWV